MWAIFLSSIKSHIKEYLPESVLKIIGTVGKIVATIGGLGLAIALYLNSSLGADDTYGGLVVFLIGIPSVLLIILGWELYTLE